MKKEELLLKVAQKLKPLNWANKKLAEGERYRALAVSPVTRYVITDNGRGVKVIYHNFTEDEPAKTKPGFKSVEEAKNWVQGEHYPSKMAKWLNPDPLTEYAAKFTQWATDRKIIQNSNTQTQTLKLASEVGELADNIAKGRDTKDDIGDSFVVLNNLVEMQGYTWQECLEQAWSDIKDRKGHMNENGVFIKQGDELYTETWTDGHDDADEVGAEWRRLMEKD